MKNSSLPILALLLVMGIALIFAVGHRDEAHEASQPAFGSVADATAINAATTSAAIAVTSSTRVLASSSQPTGLSFTRVYATICNPSTNLVYLNLNFDRAASLPGGTYTAVIGAAAGYNACFEVTGRNLYQGAITASSTNQTSTSVQVSDYVQ